MAMGSRARERKASLRDGLRSQRCDCCRRIKKAFQFPYRDKSNCTECYGKLDKGVLMTGSRTTRAVMMCKSEQFRLYLDYRVRERRGVDISTLPDGTHNEQDARDAICRACNVKSRAELTNARAAAMFDRINHDFNAWVLNRRASAEKMRWS